ncbi:MAG: hypothetical protein ABIV63_08280 [Caldimonas sp.]
MTPLLTTTSTVLCPHAGQALLVTTNTEALIDGAPALLATDVHPVVGCTFWSGPTYMPCVSIRWSGGTTQAALHGVPLLLQSSIGVCYNALQAPQGVAIVVQAQTRAQAS